MKEAYQKLERIDQAIAIAEKCLETKYDPARHAEIQAERHEAIAKIFPMLDDSAMTEGMIHTFLTVARTRRKTLKSLEWV